MDRRTFLMSALGAATAALAPAQLQKPNIILIYADDLGYGDLGVYGSSIQTPNLDQMADEGVRFRQFYSASAVCSPSRAALLTGRYQTRVGIPRVIYSDDVYGLPSGETTMAQMLKGAGYKTMCIGKWHLGSLPEFLPTNRGFDEFYGVPYSNDMQPLPLMHNLTVLEPDTELSALTPKYTQQAVDFITRSKDGPFFLYIPHTYPHIPLAASARFKGKSGLGLYGDAVEEMDWSVGEVLNALKTNGIDDNTLVVFSSDNGPWFLGSAGGLRGRKGETYEGGVREPFIARFPGKIPIGTVSSGIATTMDLLPTFARLAGASLPGKPLDGIDIWPLLTGESNDLSREALLYFDNWNLQCARLGRWKLHVARYNGIAWTPDPPGGRINLPLFRPELYDLQNDPDESYDLAADNPQIVADIRARMESLLPSFPDQVRAAWRDTFANSVNFNPAGALPSKRTP
ncbi:MAG: sulfatase [Bryobacteraceae bacterium]